MYEQYTCNVKFYRLEIFQFSNVVCVYENEKTQLFTFLVVTSSCIFISFFFLLFCESLKRGFYIPLLIAHTFFC